MSSAPARIPLPFGRMLRGVGWTLLFAVLAASGAGLIGAAGHAPGSPARAELTWAGDAAVGRRLDVATEELRRIADDVERLAGRAKTALAEVTSTDPTRLKAALEQGGEIAAAIDSEAFDLRQALAGLPGDGPNASLDYSNGTLVRRAAILAAIDAAGGLAAQWQQVSGRAGDAAQLTTLIATHDTTVLDATAKGRDTKYPEAIALLGGAILTVAEVKSLRARLIAGTEPTVLDEWIERNGAFDAALRALYAALIASKGKVTVEVQSANREMEEALAQLPPDRRTIIVIVAEVARGGLTQAVLAIDEAGARIDEAIAEAAPT